MIYSPISSRVDFREPSIRSIQGQVNPERQDLPRDHGYFDSVDLSIIILPPKACVRAVEESIAKGVKGIVIVSAGFREVGGEGIEIENRIISLCKAAKVRLVAQLPRVINPLPDVSLNASFSRRMPACGTFRSSPRAEHSARRFSIFAADRDFGFSKFISIGNKATSTSSTCSSTSTTTSTRRSSSFTRGAPEGQEFIEAVKEITSGHRPTPVIIIKSGRTSAGAQAAASHTGALAGTEAVYDAIFKQAGIIRADSIAELFDFANAFAYKRESALARRGGRSRRKTGRHSDQRRGPGILATDMTVSSDLELARFSEETIEELRSHLPRPLTSTTLWTSSGTPTRTGMSRPLPP